MHRGAHARWHLDPVRTLPRKVRTARALGPGVTKFLQETCAGHWPSDQRVVMGGLLTMKPALSQDGHEDTILARPAYADPPLVGPDKQEETLA